MRDLIVHTKSSTGVVGPYHSDSQSGSGIVETIKDIFNKGKDFIKKADDAYFGETGTIARNVVADVLQSTGIGSKYGRPSYPREKHMILKDYDGKLVTANYAGQMGLQK